MLLSVGLTSSGPKKLLCFLAQRRRHRGRGENRRQFAAPRRGPLRFAIVELRDRFAAATTRCGPAARTRSAMVGSARYLPPLTSSPFRTSFFDGRVDDLLRRGSRPVFAIRHQPGAVRICADRNRRAIYLRHGRIDRVMIARTRRLRCAASTRVGRVLLGDEVGAHPVPDDDDDFARLRCFGCDERQARRNRNAGRPFRSTIASAAFSSARAESTNGEL